MYFRCFRKLFYIRIYCIAKMQTQGVIMEQDVVSKIESGDRLVTDYEVRAFAAVFGVAFENLIEDEE